VVDDPAVMKSATKGDRVPGRKDTHLELLFIVLLAAVSFSLYFAALSDPFYNDDIHLLYDASRFGLDQLSPQFEAARFFRPVWRLYFAFLYSLFGLNPLPYHLVGIVLHIANALLIYFLVKRLWNQSIPGFAVALLFAISPKLNESVQWISAVCELSACFFMLAAILLYLRYLARRKKSCLAFSCVSFALALLSKETAITTPALLFLAEAFVVKRVEDTNGLVWIKQAWTRYVPYIFILAVYAIAYLPYIGSKAIVLEGAYGIGWHCIYKPFEVGADLIFNSSQWYGIVLVCGLFAASLIKGDRFYRFGVLWFLCAMIPFMPITAQGLEQRFNYIPVIGICILYVAILQSLHSLLAKHSLWSAFLLPVALCAALAVGFYLNSGEHIAEFGERSQEYFGRLQKAAEAEMQGREFNEEEGGKYLGMWVKLLEKR
jgi:hypothetical protein